MTRIYIWLSETLFDWSMKFEAMAIGQKALRAYRKALDNPTHANAAADELQIASRRIGFECGATDTIGRCMAQMRRVQHEVSCHEMFEPPEGVFRNKEDAQQFAKSLKEMYSDYELRRTTN